MWYDPILKDLEQTTLNLLDLKNTFGNVSYKINVKRSVTFLYTNHKQAENEIRKTIPFTIV
jgi:hypothetical protein